MGEYALRKSDRVEVKIGTCEEMFYLRWEDRTKVAKLPNSLDPSRMNGLYFRLPFLDEDSIAIGEYEDHSRGLRLYRMVPHHVYGKVCEDYSNAELADHPGIIQLRHEKAGLLLNVPCYHGERLPDCGPSVKAFWNGKGHSYEMTSVKTAAEGLRPVISCRHCHQAWSFAWTDIWEYIPTDMQKRFVERGYFAA